MEIERLSITLESDENGTHRFRGTLVVNGTEYGGLMSTRGTDPEATREAFFRTAQAVWKRLNLVLGLPETYLKEVADDRPRPARGYDPSASQDFIPPVR